MSEWILETHANADQLSAAHYLKGVLGGSIGIGEHICRVQETFKPLFNLETEFKTDDSQFDYLLADEEIIKLGHVNIIVIHAPGHTPGCVSYLIDDAVFVGHDYKAPTSDVFAWETTVLEQQRSNVHNKACVLSMSMLKCAM